MLREPQGKASQKYGNKCGCLSSGSVIIYVWRKKDTEYIAEQLRTYGDLGKVVCYHAGMTTRERAVSQNLVSPFYRTISYEGVPRSLIGFSSSS